MAIWRVRQVPGPACVLDFGQWLKHEANTNSCHHNLMFVSCCFFAILKCLRDKIREQQKNIKCLKTLPLLILLWMLFAFLKKEKVSFIHSEFRVSSRVRKVTGQYTIEEDIQTDFQYKSIRECVIFLLGKPLLSWHFKYTCDVLSL